ncbi:MAG: hypothetical protein L0G59_01085 [Kocuria sp.]|nr:hypothetical protein [Kocuria sp.]MDN5618667.1 hypothetical protein [Kocuria sp.]MDN5653721.1 hypothetical protein [Kocuria sp.]
MTDSSRDDEFTFMFRLKNRAVRTLLIFVGPAQGSSQSDPRQRLKREYDRRKALHEQRQNDGQDGAPSSEAHGGDHDGE